MVTTLGVVEVQPAVEALPKRSPLAGIARRRFGGKTLLEWVVRRISDAQHIGHVVVLSGDDSLSRSLAELAPADAEVFVSSAADRLGRLTEVVRHFACEGVVPLSVSTPFVDPLLVDRLITAATSDDPCDYLGYAFGDGCPACESKMGIFSQWCRGEALLSADREVRQERDRSQPTRCIYSRPDRYSVRFLPTPTRLDRRDLCLAIHEEEDWEHVELILDALGPESLDWQYILTLVDRHPDLARPVQSRRETASFS